MNEETESKKFGKRLRAQRLKVGIPQSKLAKITHMLGRSISNFECGHRLPSYLTIKALAEALDCTADYLLGLEKNETDFNPIGE